MKTGITRILGFLMLMTFSASGIAKQGLGVGAIVGEPTGISVKTWTNKKHALDFAAAWSLSQNDNFQFHMDYLIHNFSAIRTDASVGRLPLYYGIGGRIKLQDNKGNDNDTLFGVRFPLGISYVFTKAPFDFFAEIVPIVDLAPDTDFDINAAVGIRVYLH
jgi:hypothetical protein